MIEIHIGDKTYAIGRIRTAMEQLHVARRLTPAFVSMLSMAGGLEGLFEATSTDDPEALLNSLLSALLDLKKVQPFAEALAKIPDDDVDYVAHKCLAAVQVQSGAGGGYAPMVAGGKMIFEDTSLSTLVQLIFAVLKESLGNFTTAQT